MPLNPLNILDAEKAYISIFKQYHKWPAAVNKQKDLLLFFLEGGGAHYTIKCFF